MSGRASEDGVVWDNERGRILRPFCSVEEYFLCQSEVILNAPALSREASHKEHEAAAVYQYIKPHNIIFPSHQAFLLVENPNSLFYGQVFLNRKYEQFFVQFKQQYLHDVTEELKKIYNVYTLRRMYFNSTSSPEKDNPSDFFYQQTDESDPLWLREHIKRNNVTDEVEGILFKKLLWCQGAIQSLRVFLRIDEKYYVPRKISTQSLFSYLEMFLTERASSYFFLFGDIVKNNNIFDSYVRDYLQDLVRYLMIYTEKFPIKVIALQERMERVINVGCGHKYGQEGDENGAEYSRKDESKKRVSFSSEVVVVILQNKTVRPLKRNIRQRRTQHMQQPSSPDTQ